MKKKLIVFGITFLCGGIAFAQVSNLIPDRKEGLEAGLKIISRDIEHFKAQEIVNKTKRQEKEELCAQKLRELTHLRLADDEEVSNETKALCPGL